MGKAGPESHIVRSIIAAINADPRRSHARKVHGDMYGNVGEPDIDACIDGFALKLEVKVPGKHPTPRQEKALRDWAAAGAYAGCVHSLEEAMEIINLIGRDR